MKENLFKKWLVVGIILIFICSGYVSGYHESNTSSESPRLVDATVKGNDGLTEDDPLLTPLPIALFKNTSDDVASIVIDTPDEFSWKNFEGHDWTSPAKDQGQCGCCGVFAAMGILESVINIREGNANIDPDFSEQYVLSCLPNAALVPGEGCSGGMGYTALLLMMETTPEGNNHNGALFESCFPYQESDNIPCENKCSQWDAHLVPLMECEQIWAGNDSAETREVIKSLILQKGPITAYMEVPLNPNTFHRWGALHHKPTDYFPYTDKPLVVLNHEVILVGWRDDASIGNGGYWIGKNSWGTDWGYDGFFNIEYGSCFIGYIIEWVDYDPEQYDWGPTVPTIHGPKFGKSGQDYEYTFTSVDPDGNDDFYLFIDWGDGIKEEWIGPYESGEEVTTTHQWNNQGRHTIKAKAKDLNNAESEWGELTVNMLKTKAIKPLFVRLLEHCPLLARLLHHGI